LITTATRRLGAQLDSRLFSLDVPDSQDQIRAALRTQASIEVAGAPEPSPALIAYQSLLQLQAPWDVSVPFAPALADAIGAAPVGNRISRDYLRLLGLVKAVTI